MVRLLPAGFPDGTSSFSETWRTRAGQNTFWAARDVGVASTIPLSIPSTVKFAVAENLVLPKGAGFEERGGLACLFLAFARCFICHFFMAFCSSPGSRSKHSRSSTKTALKRLPNVSSGVCAMTWKEVTEKKVRFRVDGQERRMH